MFNIIVLDKRKYDLKGIKSKLLGYLVEMRYTFRDAKPVIKFINHKTFTHNHRAGLYVKL